VSINRRPSDDTGQIVGAGCWLPSAVALLYELHSSIMRSMDAAVTGRPAYATWHSVKPRKLSVGTSVRPFLPIIDHGVEEEDHRHHGLAAVHVADLSL
jgi:hypothetical protein